MKAMLIPIFALIVLSGLTAGTEDVVVSDNPGITPDSFLYGLDKALEKIRLVLTRDKASKARLHLRFGAERVAEARAMAEKGKPDYIPELMVEYEAAIHESRGFAETAGARRGSSGG